MATMRESAEAALGEKHEALPDLAAAEAPESLRRALHEQQVHQIELEMQNEELRRAQLALEAERARFVELYNFAPMGYCTVGEDELILNTNRTAQAMLGLPHEDLVRQRFTRFIHPDDQDRYYLLRQQLQKTGELQSVELRLLKPGSEPLCVNLSANLAPVESGAGVLRLGLSDISRIKLLEQSLRQGHDTLQGILATSLDGYWQVDLEGRLQNVNPSYCRQSGYSRDELLGMRISDLEDKESPLETARHIEQLIRDGQVQFETRHRRKDGSVWPLEVSATFRKLGPSGLIAVFLRDITERKLADTELRIAATAFESHEGVLVTDANRLILRTNQAFTRITGYTAEEVVNRPPSLLGSGRHDSAFFAAMWDSIALTGSWQGEIWNRRKSGEIYPEWLTITAVKDALEKTSHYVGTFTDVSARKAAEDQIKALAFYDPLTQLPNRRLFLDRLEQALALGYRHRHKGALMFVDLDHFKNINDSLGHDQGDQLLMQVAMRLNSSVRDGDTVARLGGDEFLVMLENLSQDSLDAARQAELVAQKILLALAQPYALDQTEQRCTASVGITLFGGEAHEATAQPMRRADLAMYQAKLAGRNRLRFYDQVDPAPGSVGA